MILITGATGKLGNLILEELIVRIPASEIAVSVRDTSKAASFAERGIQVRHGDFAKPETLSNAFRGATYLLIISSNARAFGGDPLAQHQAAINAAKAAGVQRIVYTSQIASSPVSAFPPALDHAATEVMLADSGLPWTALRNGFYADSALMFMGPDWQKGQLAAPADGKVAWATHGDLAAAAAVILTGSTVFDGPTPPLTGNEGLDLADLAAIATDLLGRPVARQVVSDEAFKTKAKERGLPDGAVRIASGYYEAARQGEFDKVNLTLEQLIGRPPKSMRDVLTAVIQTAR